MGGLPPASPRRHAWALAGLFCAITACFVVYSLIQERLVTLGFGPQQERFRHSLFIILVNRLVAVAVAASALAAQGQRLAPAAPLALFGVPSVANVLGSASQYEALKYVSFPLQALAKCAKTVPVMAWGLLLGGRRYDFVDYSCALTVTLGCALFVLTGSIAAPQQMHAAAAAQAAAATEAATAAAGAALPEGVGALTVAAVARSGGGILDGGGSEPWLLYGLLLLAAFLFFDGLTSTTQDRLFSQYEMHSCNQLLWVSVWSAGVSLALLIGTGQLGSALSFVARHPSALGYILLLSSVSTAVQLFIFYTIQQYGALHFALIMTIRQFLSIVLSCLVFNHDLSASQWLGTALVIGGLVSRGMHRGGLDRTAPRASRQPKPPAPKLSPTAAHAAAMLLPLATIPVIQTNMPESVPLLAAAGKRDSARSAVDVKAMAWGTAQPDSPADLQLRRSPSGGSLVGSATAAQAASQARPRGKLAD